MVILDAIASVNKSNQYYFSNSGHETNATSPQPSSSSSYKSNGGQRHYPGKAVDVSLSLEPSNAMGALYEANWLNAHQAMMTRKPLANSPSVGGKPSPPSRRQPQPECHSPPHLRNKPRTGDWSPPQSLLLLPEHSDRDSSASSSPAPNESGANRLSSLGQYQVTLDQIRRLEEKDANITKTICELNGFKPTPLRRRQRQMYPDWDEHSRNRKVPDEEDVDVNEYDDEEFSRGQKNNFAPKQNKDLLQRQKSYQDEDVVRRSDLVSQFLKLKSNKKFPDHRKEDNWDQDVSFSCRESLSKGGNQHFEIDDGFPKKSHEKSLENGLQLRNSMRFCGSAIDIKDLFRRKKDASPELSPKMNNKVPTSGGRKVYPKTINLTKNLVRDPVILDPHSQPGFQAEKQHRHHHHHHHHRSHHHRSHPNLHSGFEDENTDSFHRARNNEARRNMHLNQRNCDSSGSGDLPSVEDHEYEVIDYQDVTLREKPPQPEKPVKRSNTTAVARAKSVRINPVADLIVEEAPRNGISKWRNNNVTNRASMPPEVNSSARPSSGGKSGSKFNTVNGLAAQKSPSPPLPSPPVDAKSSALRRSKSINPSSFLENWNRRQRSVREESDQLPPPPATPPPSSPGGRPVTATSLRHQQSLRQPQVVGEMRKKLVQKAESPTNNNHGNGNNSGGSSAEDQEFMIPRPRLIVPVHTYARKRRTGNLRADVGTEEEEQQQQQQQGARDKGKAKSYEMQR